MTEGDQAPPAPPTGGNRRRRRLPSPARVRRSLPVIAVFTLTALVVAGLGLAPARTYLTQQRQTDEARAELQRLQAEVAELDAQLRVLRTDEAVERIAREHYDLVFPGEESYRILPAAEP